jgi:hypothetical protein
MNDACVPDAKKISASGLGGPGRPDPVRCSAAAIEALIELAGVDMGLTQIQLDVASHVLSGDEIEVRARIDKRTRSIVFASVEGCGEGGMVFRAQALFSRKQA